MLVAAGAILCDVGKGEAVAQRSAISVLRYEHAPYAANQPGAAGGAMPAPGAHRRAKTLETTRSMGAAHQRSPNADAKLLAANAAYRNMRKAGGSWQAVVGRMDSLVKQYAEILRDDPSNSEAAFNYEYVVRLRQVIAARKQPVAPVAGNDAGLTIHGFAGAPPEASDMKKFKMIVPMRPDERLEAEKAGKGTTKVRKG